MTLAQTVPGITGLCVTWILGLMFVRYLVLRVEDVRNKSEAPPGFDPLLWSEKFVGQRGGVDYLGWLERTIFFVGFWISGAWALAAGWLAFKVASKWESWKHVWEIAKWWREVVLKEDSERLLADLSKGATSWHLLVGNSHMTFLVGTGANIVVALIGVFVGRVVT